jgi:hypothetical protein
VPRGFKGKFKVEVKTYFGPFEVEQETKWHTVR